MGEILYKGRSLNTTPEDICYENEARNMRVGDAGGKNLIPYPYSNKSGNYNGVEITINDDYSISVNGTNTVGRNDFGFAGISRISDIPYMVSLKEGKSYTLSLEFFRGSLPDTSDVVINGWNDNSVVMLLAVCDSSVTSFTFTVPADSGIKHGCVYLQNKSGTVFDNVRLRPMLTEGNEVVPYEPYIPSVKMLAEENAQQNTEAMDLKMLGWTVPRECPVQNYVDGDGVFHQRVGRVDLGSLKFDYDANVFFTRISQKNIYCYLYKFVDDTRVIDNTTAGNYLENMTFTYRHGTIDRIYFKNTSYTDATTFKNAMQGVYLYYELATEQTISVDGNEAVTKVNDSLSVIGKCKNLLNSTLQTTTLNEVTCTNNGDGTYTLNGTASSDVVFELESYKPYTGNEIFRLVGCPSGGSASTYYLGFRPNNAEENRKDIGSGVTFNDLSTSNVYAVAIIVLNGTTVTNLTFKPMLTTDFNATYDDFVPYTGDGETLTHDVAEIKNDLSKKFTIGLYIDGDTDWNTMKTSGMYYYNGWSGSGGSNKPTETKSVGMVFVLNAGIRLLQFAVLESGNSYFRSGTVDELGNWTTIS